MHSNFLLCFVFCDCLLYHQKKEEHIHITLLTFECFLTQFHIILTSKLSMKLLLPSPSCSSTSSFSTSNFDPHVCNPRAAAATPSCLSGILRRILCSGSLPTHPSDQTTEETSSLKSEDNVKNVGVIKHTNGGLEAKPTAGIVARLMGLDTMPDMKQNCNSMARTQSMNSVEHFYKHLEGRHKGVRSTQSFREIPTFLELENEDYFILSFEGDSKNEELKAKARRHGEEKCKNRGSNKTEHSYVRKTKKKIFNPEEANEFVLIDLKQKKKSRKRVSRNKPTSRISTKDRHGRRSTRKVESEQSSDELSPVSVLDSSEFLRDSEEAAPLSGFISLSSTNPNSDSSIWFLKSHSFRRRRFEIPRKQSKEIITGARNLSATVSQRR